MSRLNAPLIPLLLCSLGSCYNPELPAGKFSCSQPGDLCPDGQSCVAGRCQLDPSGEDTDLGAGRDLLPQPCTLSGVQVAPDVWACKGRFSSGGFAALCGAGYHACAVAADSARLQQIDHCDDGFYAVALDLSINIKGEVNCPPSGGARAILGCGGEDGVLTIDDKKLDCPSAAPMKGLRSLFSCFQLVPRDWSCSNGLGDASHRFGDSKGGALCCPTP